VVVAMSLSPWSRTVDETGRVRTDAGCAAWQVLRLASDLQHRWFHDQGVEAAVWWRSAEDIEVVLSTPHCKRETRQLARLEPRFSSLVVAAERGETWRQARVRCFDALGVGEWEQRDHKDCFHRRAKARAPLVLDVAAQLASTHRTGRVESVHPRELRRGSPEWTDWAFRPEDLADPARRAAPRHLAVYGDGPLALIRTDGHATTRTGEHDLTSLWRRGLEVADLAAALARPGRQRGIRRERIVGGGAG